MTGAEAKNAILPKPAVNVVVLNPPADVVEEVKPEPMPRE
jgi:hypothetical protein